MHKEAGAVLIGHLQHACRVVKPGRTFLRRMINLSTVARELYHHIRLNRGFRSDLAWWAVPQGLERHRHDDQCCSPPTTDDPNLRCIGRLGLWRFLVYRSVVSMSVAGQLGPDPHYGKRAGLHHAGLSHMGTPMEG